MNEEKNVYLMFPTWKAKKFLANKSSPYIKNFSVVSSYDNSTVNVDNSTVLIFDYYPVHRTVVSET